MRMREVRRGGWPATTHTPPPPRQGQEQQTRSGFYVSSALAHRQRLLTRSSEPPVPCSGLTDAPGYRRATHGGLEDRTEAEANKGMRCGPAASALADGVTVHLTGRQVREVSDIRIASEPATILNEAALRG